MKVMKRKRRATDTAATPMEAKEAAAAAFKLKKRNQDEAGSDN